MSSLTYPSGEEETLRAVPDPDGNPPRVLVLGATGYIGGRLTPRLLNAGYRVRVLARNAMRASSFAWGGDCEIIEGSAEDADVVDVAMADVDIVFYLIHAMWAAARPRILRGLR